MGRVGGVYGYAYVHVGISKLQYSLEMCVGDGYALYECVYVGIFKIITIITIQN